MYWFSHSSLSAYSSVRRYRSISPSRPLQFYFSVSDRNYIITGFNGLLVFVQFLLGIISYGMEANVSTFQQLSTDFRVVHAINSLSVAADGSIALTLVFLLHKTRSGFRRTDTVINRLIIYSINTSLVTSICSVGSLVATIAWPQTFIFLFFFFTFPRSKSY